MSLPANALHGASTHRAVLNFPVSGYRFSRPFIRALGLIKGAAAQANHDLGLLDAERAALISQAAEEVAEGKLDDHFPLDIFQTGSGTSTNTNANEVIANRSAQLAGKPIGSREHVHPNDHVNMGQSSNDVIPSAIHISAAEELKNRLIPALEKLHGALEAKAKEFWDIIKIGRTHLMDATPIRLGQEFSGYAQQVAYAKARAQKSIEALRELPLGGTAVGTGLNRHVDLPKKMLRHLEQRTGIAFYEAKNHFEAQGGKDAVVEASGQLKTIAVSLFKIANDIRWLGSGPRCGIGEIQLPATQPGSSIMPGKVNPGHVRIGDDGVRAGDRQRHDHHLGRREREFRAQRDDAGDGTQSSRIDPIAGERRRCFLREMRARYRRKRRALPRVGRTFHGNGDQSRAEDRL